MNQSVQISIMACTLFPFVLALMARVTILDGKNASQFFLSYLVVSIPFLYLLLHLSSFFTESFWTSFFLYHGIMLVYLEIWGLLSRGYTLGLLLTFYKAKTPLTSDELANRYRGGEGLNWLIKHRFMGLAAAKMIRIENNQVTLTHRGMLIAICYKLCILFFGLRYSG